MMARLLCLGALLLLPVVSWAHKPSDAYLTLHVEGTRIAQRLDIALRDLDRDLVLDANDNGLLEWREVRTRWSEIDQLSQQGLSLAADGQNCTPGTLSSPQLDTHSDGRYAVLLREWRCPSEVSSLAVNYTLFAQTDPLHRGVVRVQEQPAVLTPGSGPQRFALASPRPGLASLVAQGVHHIAIGTDHVLFLLALLLPAVLAAPLRPVVTDVVRVVTAFTLAHSVTLGLAAFEVVNPPSRLVESLIAASVLLAAINNLYPVVREGRWKLTFAFGLVHGFGFASALKDLGLTRGELAAPLLAFNGGVELGQLAIVAVFIALVWRLRHTRVYRRVMLRGGSVLIGALALAWLVERSLDLQLPWPL